jgi:3,4-dihydroxy 2-butanone 4-phosphate synthase / GTP cyclohydrolase II
MSDFDTIETAIAAFAAGQPIVVTDDEDRENEGDLIVAAAKATPEAVNLMIREARGLICVPMTGPRLRRLGIDPMVQRNRESHGTAFTVSVDAAEGITTGISAYDRSLTIRLLADPATTPDLLVQPGHVFPLEARPGGVLERAGHTEAAVDLALLAGLDPCAAICEILNEDGTMARGRDLVAFKARHGTPLISIAALISHRLQREPLVALLSTQTLATAHGDFQVHRFRALGQGDREHIALVRGEPGPAPALARVQVADPVRDVFQGSGGALDHALATIAAADRGVIVYLAPERESGPARPTPSSAAALRTYGIGAQILAALGFRQLRLITSHPRRIPGLEGFGLEIVEHVPR